MEVKVDRSNYVWVIVERSGHEEHFFGLSTEEGDQFIPVTDMKDQGEALLGRLQVVEGVERTVEAINKVDIIKQGQAHGFAVYQVNSEGKLVGHLASGEEQ